MTFSDIAYGVQVYLFLLASMAVGIGGFVAIIAIGVRLANAVHPILAVAWMIGAMSAIFIFGLAAKSAGMLQ